MKLTKLLKTSGFFNGAAMLAIVASSAMAQSVTNPCDPPNLYPGKIVYDANQGVCWLADANLAGKPAMQAQLAVPRVNPNGTMDFVTALNWVAALNADHNGAGYLGHTNWQLPITPQNDPNCASFGRGGGFFGPLCSGGTMGEVYYTTLKLNYPNSVAPGFGVPVTTYFQDLKSSYYWTQSPATDGQQVYSFTNDTVGGVTTDFPYYYALPMVLGPINGAPTCPSRSGVLPYVGGPAAFRAVLDCATNYTWVADGNLANQDNFNIAGNVAIVSNRGFTLTPPAINGGAMLYATATQWITNMNTSKYLGSHLWQLPPDAASLHRFGVDLGLVHGDVRLAFTGKQGSFQNIQPFYYWGCQEESGVTESPCTGYAPPGPDSQQMQWTFNFDDGFQGTAATTQQFFVMVYFPAPPPPAPHCTNPQACCAEAGGYWSGGLCH